MALFQELGRDGITIVLVTHEPDIAEYAARVVVMRDGRITLRRAADAAATPPRRCASSPPPEATA